MTPAAPKNCFNPVLGFLSVSTSCRRRSLTTCRCFNPVLGFLSVSTWLAIKVDYFEGAFQSRAGFSECLDPDITTGNVVSSTFQSRAGFSECLDVRVLEPHGNNIVSIPCWVF